MDMFIEILKAFFIGVVEGITEWLPISSTGHMILVDEFVKLNVSPEFLELFLVVIQLGAIMAVLILYFHKLNPFSPRKTAPERRGTWRLWGMVAIGCIPAAAIGLTLDDFFNEYFYNAWTVAVALIVYGVVFILLERRNRKREAAWLAKRFAKRSDSAVDDIRHILGVVGSAPQAPSPGVVRNAQRRRDHDQPLHRIAASCRRQTGHKSALAVPRQHQLVSVRERQPLRIADHSQQVLNLCQCRHICGRPIAP